MGIFNSIANRLMGVKHDDLAQYVLEMKHGGSKYWKNFNDFDKYDFVKVPDRSGIRNFLGVSTKGLNIFNLVCNPAIQSVTFSMASTFPATKPTVCFVGTSGGYFVPAGELKNKCDVKIYELGRVFIRLAPNGPEDRNMVENIGEARYVIVEDDKLVHALPIVVAHNPKITRSAAEKYIASAIKYYIAIQIAMMYRPEFISNVTIRHKDKSSEKPERPRKSERIVKVRKVITKEIEAPVSFEEQPAEEETSGNTIKCPAWGVSGHYRHLKDGRVIWIKPYVKGKERNNPAAYSKKTYQILNN